MVFPEALRAASGGGHTLRSYDLEMILVLHSDGVSDGGHSVDVMKNQQAIVNPGNWNGLRYTHKYENITHSESGICGPISISMTS